MSRTKSAVKGAVKVGDKLLIPVATATVAGVAANQFPQNQRSSKKALKEIKKNDPNFNTEVAEKVFDLVCKMDPDEARMFALLTLAEIHEDDIEKNQRALQSHLNKVVEKRINRVSKAFLNTVAKGADDTQAKAYAEALATIKKAYQNPYVTGRYHFQESDFRRDQRTGRFQAKVHVDPSRRKPLDEKQAANLGININHQEYKNLTPEAKRQYQQEYMQIANFLNVVTQNGQPGDHDVYLQVRNKKSGMRHWVPVNGRVNAGKNAGAQWDPDEERVEVVEARPNSLTLGGAAFGLTGALSGEQVAGINHVDQNFGDFARDWTDPEADPFNQNQRLYSRVKTSSEALAGLGAATGNEKLMIAGKLASAVGSHGPEAEKVFGPASRKTAYRYRGTSKTPDAEIVRQYDMAVGRGEKAHLSEEQTSRLRARQSRAVTNLRQQKAEATKTPVEAVKLTTAEVAAERKKVADAYYKQIENKPDPETQRKAVISVLGSYLTDRNRKGVPNKDYYNLQLEAGVTPPSEGFMLDKNGKIVAQAVGYGDDHYLPFNLKQLNKLKGGEYIRTRSVGGPTSEDIYTGLVSGANRVTVVSRSGTFTVDFNEELKGNRRYNDKARRMTRRYEKLLDAVQSEQVQRPVSISPTVRRRLMAEVDEEGAGLDRPDRRKLMERKVAEYKTELSQERDEFSMYVHDQTQGLSEEEAKAYTFQMMNDWTKHNEFQYRLNGEGYHAALKSLQEQFPYYIDTAYYPKGGDEEVFAREKDQGYVEPGRNRPTAANAGWYGTSVNAGTGFISASEANYQRGKYGAPSDRPATERVGGRSRQPEPVVSDQDAKENAAPDGVGSLKAVDAPLQMSEQKVKEINEAATKTYQDAALNLVKVLRDNPQIDHKVLADGLPVNATEDWTILQEFKTPEQVRAKDEYISRLGPWIENTPDVPQEVKDAYSQYKQASGQLGRVNYDPKLALTRKGSPFLFPGQAFLPGADPTLAQKKAEQIALRTRPVSSSALSLDEMTDDDLNNEIDVLHKVASGMKMAEGQAPEEKLKTLREFGIDTSIPGVGRILNSESLDQHMKDVQMMRALNLNRGNRTHSEIKTQVRHLEPRTEAQTLGIKEDATNHISALEKAAEHLEKIDNDGSLEPVADAFRTKAHEFKRMVQSKEVDEGTYGVAWREAADEIMLSHAIVNGSATKEQIEAYRDRLEL